ncbi:MAG TPA: ATP-binding cassette domain-containing protein [Candidatus Acidoferrales bacterium]|nr:ATP-binding cassette domain-containing protein [Candidatus Acidoferrales bacterium]
MPENDHVAVSFDHVSYRLPDGRALIEDLVLEVARGETVVLLGRSGSGKTTTMKLINRLLDPTEGTVLVDGRSTTEWDPIRLRRRIGYVIQEVGLFPHFTVEENVALVPRLEKWDEERINARAAELLRLVGLEPEKFASRYPHELSGGQRQRVGVARALAADPPIVLLDEPFGALDPITRREIQQEFQALQRRLGKTVVFVTHDVREAFLLASRIGLLRDGKMIFLGRPEELLASADPEARSFVACLREPERTLPPA